MNDVADLGDTGDDDDCAELDCDDDFNVVLLANSRRIVDLNSFGNDFSQATSDCDENTTVVLDSPVSEFDIILFPSQCRRLSIDPRDINVIHVQFWNSGIHEKYANRHTFSQPAHISSP